MIGGRIFSRVYIIMLNVTVYSLLVFILVDAGTENSSVEANPIVVDCLFESSAK